MEDFSFLAPAHNPPYIAAIRAFRQELPGVPLVAVMEPFPYRFMDEASTTYSVPYEWRSEYGIRRYGFHGASHRSASERVQALLGRNWPPPHLLPSRRQLQPGRLPQRRRSRHQHGRITAVRPAAKQPRRRHRRLRRPAHDEEARARSGPDGRLARHPLRPRRYQRNQRRSPRPDRAAAAGERVPSLPSTSLSARSATISARSCSSLAASTLSLSPAASAKTARNPRRRLQKLVRLRHRTRPEQESIHQGRRPHLHRQLRGQGAGSPRQRRDRGRARNSGRCNRANAAAHAIAAHAT